MNTNFSLIHSFWTKPIKDFTRWGYKQDALLWYAAFSLLEAKNSLPNTEFNLHTDTAGANILNLLPYDNIITDLNNIDVNSRFWAAGKIQAIENAPINSIHIDLDVILHNAKIAEYLNFDNNDLIVQNAEPIYLREQTYLKFLNAQLVDYTDKGSYNCGVIGFSNAEFKTKYVAAYKDFTKKVLFNKRLFDKIHNYNNNVCFDLLAEQSQLFAIAQKGEYKVKTLSQSAYKTLTQLDYIGYTHFIGTQKFFEHNLNYCKERVKELNEDIYNKLCVMECEGLDKLLND